MAKNPDLRDIIRIWLADNFDKKRSVDLACNREWVTFWEPHYGVNEKYRERGMILVKGYRVADVFGDRIEDWQNEIRFEPADPKMFDKLRRYINEFVKELP